MVGTIILLLVGLGFGFSLNKAGLTRYNKIVDTFRLTDLTVLKFMLTTLVVAMSGLFLLRGLRLLTFPNVPATYVVGNLVGGLVFGAGMAITGF